MVEPTAARRQPGRRRKEDLGRLAEPHRHRLKCPAHVSVHQAPSLLDVLDAAALQVEFLRESHDDVVERVVTVGDEVHLLLEEVEECLESLPPVSHPQDVCGLVPLDRLDQFSVDLAAIPLFHRTPWERLVIPVARDARTHLPENPACGVGRLARTDEADMYLPLVP